MAGEFCLKNSILKFEQIWVQNLVAEDESGKSHGFRIDDIGFTYALESLIKRNRLVSRLINSINQFIYESRQFTCWQFLRFCKMRTNLSKTNVKSVTNNNCSVTKNRSPKTHRDISIYRLYLETFYSEHS